VLEERRGACRFFLWGNLWERDHMKDLGIDGDKINMDLQ
jgi:hypothetical protein